MATVPIQTGPSVELGAGQPQPFAAPNVEAQQSMTGRQIAALGNAERDMGSVMVRTATHIQDEINDYKSKVLYNKIATEADRLHTEFSMLSGAEALKRQPEFVQKFNEIKKLTFGEAENDGQRMLFNVNTMPLERTFTASVNTHAQKEFKKVDTIETLATVGNHVQSMAREYGSIGAKDANGQPSGNFAMYEAAAINKLEEYANKSGIPIRNENGELTETFKTLAQEKIYGPAAASVTQSLLRGGSHEAANKFLEDEWKAGRIDTDSYQKLKGAVGTADDQKQGEKAAREIFSGYQVQGGVTYNAPYGAAPADVRMTSGMGTRVAPMAGASTNHKGTDYAMPEGSAILAAADGTVTDVKRSPTGYGIMVTIGHGEKAKTLYAHMSEANVTVGQVVTSGQPIGVVGKTGTATGTHLHFEAYDPKGVPIDPRTYAWGTAIGEGKVIATTKNRQEQKQRIEAIPNDNVRKIALVQFEHLVNQFDEAERKQKIEAWNFAMDFSYSGDGNNYQAFVQEHPVEASLLTAEQRAHLQRGVPRADDQNVIFQIQDNPNLKTKGQIEQFRPYLSAATYAQYRAEGMKPDEIRDATFDREIFKGVLVDAGFKKYMHPEKDSVEERNMIKLHDAVNQAIISQQSQIKRNLTYNEKKTIMTQVVGDQIQGGGLFGRPIITATATKDQFNEAFTVQTDAAGVRREIPVASITEENRALSKKILNNFVPWVSEDQIAKFQPELQSITDALKEKGVPVNDQTILYAYKLKMLQNQSNR